jgi:MYXO-CTERM domain-containing protein
MSALLALLFSSPGWAADLEIDGAGANPDDTLSGLLVYDDVRIVNGGVLYVNGTLNLTARSIFVDESSRIDGVGAGVQGIVGGGTGAAGGGVAGDGGGGGGHGGAGARGFDATCATPSGAGGAVVGNATDGIVEQGQPGGGVKNGASLLAAGGAGGGALHLDAEISVMRGTISLNGDPGVPGAWGGGGGGAGGSAFLEADVLLCDGRIEAAGGDGADGVSPGGGGGGGHVELRWDSAGRPCDLDVTGGRGQCANGAPGAASGLGNQDWDGDGTSAVAGDCQPTVSAIGPAALETGACDGIDQDCDGLADDGLTCGFNCASFAADGNSYASCEVDSTHAQALSDCASFGSGRYYLGVIGSSAENAGILAAVNDTDDHWISLVEPGGMEDAFFWQAPEDSVYTNWDAGEPNNNNNAQDCVRVEMSNSALWHDQECGETADFLCERCEMATWYTDGDGDGYGNDSRTTEDCIYLPPVDGTLTGGDCDDADAAIFPGAEELCDGEDSDCDGTPDPLSLTLYADLDSDGYGDPTSATVVQACSGFAATLATNALDCDDTRSAAQPGALETCNGEDDDCNGVIDDGDVCEGTPEDCYAYHSATSTYLACYDNENQPGAKAECAGFGGGYQLASLTSNAEDLLADEVVDRVDPAEEFWIGLEDVVPNTYTWPDGTPFGFSDYASGQPNDTNGSQDCTGISDVNNDEDSWYDLDCNFFHHYLCEAACIPLDWYADQDGDGWGDTADVSSSCTPIPGHVLAPDDCDDADPLTHPNAGEVGADGVDQDCDGLDACFSDTDGDQHGEPGKLVLDSGAVGCTDGGEALADDDCDDNDPLFHPGAAEAVGTGDDNDCDTLFPCFFDGDGDGVGGAVVPSPDAACTAPFEAVIGGDCDDANPLLFPGGAEIVGDGIDQDCDNKDSCYQDLDGDDFGDDGVIVDDNGLDCDDGGPRSSVGGDCDDGDPAARPGAAEQPADGVDQDCDGGDTCFSDGDLDGFAGATLLASADLDCADPGEAAVFDDCDDLDPTVNPGAAEVIGDDLDQDCDNKDSCFQDLDGDDFGDDNVVVDDNGLDCDDGGPRASLGGDCDDGNPQVGPGAPEIPADGIDQDCDLGDTCFSDGDGDGAAGGTLVGSADLDCSDPGEADVATDCDDADPAVFPGAQEVVGDFADQDCDNRDSCWEDLDGDDFGSAVIVIDNGLDCDDGGSRTSLAGDCDDAVPQIHPGATELPVDGIDQDCDGGDACFDDADSDGFAGDLQTTPSADLDCADPGEFGLANDCDDADASVFPGAAEVIGDDLDQDCDNRDSCYEDLDGDDFGSAVIVVDNGLECDDAGPRTSVPGDCDDADDTAFPGASEIPGDEADGNCDGGELCFADNDHDGSGTPTTIPSIDLDCADFSESTTSDDCDDGDPGVFPAAAEIPGDGIDQNCDGDDGCFEDLDGDGFGSLNTVVSADQDCDDPGESDVATDCLDTDANVSPAGLEIPVDGLDQDCDGGDTCFEDDDGDGSGSGNLVPSADLDCDDLGESADDLDCDDNDVASGPGAPEIPSDGTDQDCDGGDTCYTDADGDSFGVATPVASADLDCDDVGEADDTTDCDDGNASAFPGGIEVIGDGIDQDCDGEETCFLDGDGDGSGTPATIGSADADCSDALESTTSNDCDDNNGLVTPGAAEILGDGLDQDCDGDDACLADADLDGFGDDGAVIPSGDLDCTDPGEALSGGDCDDVDATVNPGAVETAGNTVDEDCDDALDCFDDGDGDGFGGDDAAVVASADLDCSDAGESLSADDCDDADATANPVGTEIANDTIDQDCDGSDLVESDTDTDTDTDTDADTDADTDSDTDIPVVDDRQDTVDTASSGTGEGCDCDTGAPGPASLAPLLALATLIRRRRQ